MGLTTKTSALLLLPLLAGGCTRIPDPQACIYDRSRRLSADDSLARDAVEKLVGRTIVHPVWQPVDGRLPAAGQLDTLYYETRVERRRPAVHLTRLSPESASWCPEERVDLWLTISVRDSQAEVRGVAERLVHRYNDGRVGAAPYAGPIPLTDAPTDWGGNPPLVADTWEEGSWEDENWRVVDHRISSILPTDLGGRLDGSGGSRHALGISTHVESDTVELAGTMGLYDAFVGSFRILDDDEPWP